MPQRKPAKSAVPTAPLPPPNTSHPCYALLATSTGELPTRPHESRSHVFFSLPSNRAAAPPPKKKQKKTDELPPAIDAAWEAEKIQRKLLKWFDARRGERTMPWRKDGVPSEMTRKERSQRGYEVWVSEIMLQQTQVATVVSYYERWIAKFPTVVALAKASVDDVNAIWTGLGYYSRAKRLLEGAQTVVRDFDGLVPEDVEDLLKIEGIGPYSAGAISSIAFGKRSALVDGNVTRVLSRLTALHAPATAKSTTSFIWALADLLVPEQIDSSVETKDQIKNRPGSWNQGLMELGATVCAPKNPKCGECPISEECLGYQEARYLAHRAKSAKRSSPSPPIELDVEDLCTLCSPLPLTPDDSKTHSVELYPMAKERKKQREEETAVCLVEWKPSKATGEDASEAKKKVGNQVLVMKRPEKGLLAGLLEFPSVDIPLASDSTLSTSSARSKHLSNLLKSLIELPSDFKISRSSSSSGQIEVDKTETLEPVVHVYSHIIRTYHTIRLVLTSPSLPKLLTAPSPSKSSSSSSKSATRKSKTKPSRARDDDSDAGDDEMADALVQSRVGAGKWIDEDEVEGASLGGAMKKVWELRRDASSTGRALTAAVNATKGKAGKKGGSKQQQAQVEKGQKTLAGFFGGGGGGGAKQKDLVKKAVDRVEEDDEVVVVEEKTVAQVDLAKSRVGDRGGAAIVKMDVAAKVEETRKVYKKRTIAPTSDEEDEE